jgi:hypothetical protein
MTYTLKLNKTIAPKKSKLQEWAESPVGWWKVTTEGDVEGRSTDQLGTHYGHVVEIAMSLPRGGCYSLRFEKAKEPSGVYGSPEDHHKDRQAVRNSANISLDTIGSYKGGEKEIAKWLDCDEVVVKPCNYCGAYTIVLKA